MFKPTATAPHLELAGSPAKPRAGRPVCLACNHAAEPPPLGRHDRAADAKACSRRRQATVLQLPASAGVKARQRQKSLRLAAKFRQMTNKKAPIFL